MQNARSTAAISMVKPTTFPMMLSYNGNCLLGSLSCIITGGPAPILRSVNEVSPKAKNMADFE